MAKPKPDLPMPIIETACFFFPTAEQVLAVLAMNGHAVSHDTLVRFLKAKTGMTFEEYRDKVGDMRRLRLMHKALTMADDGNVPMLIFSLKNLCNWRDKPKDEDDKYRSMTTQELIVLVKEKLPELEGQTKGKNDKEEDPAT